MEKSRILGTNMVFVCYVVLKEARIHINFFCLHSDFDHPHITVVTFVPENSPESHDSPPPPPPHTHTHTQKTTTTVSVEKSLQDASAIRFCPHFLVKIARLFWKSYFCCTFEKLTKNILFGCSGVRVVRPFSKKPNFQNGQKSSENKTNLDIILLFLAKPLDKTWYHTGAYHLSALDSLWRKASSCAKNEAFCIEKVVSSKIT